MIVLKIAKSRKVYALAGAVGALVCMGAGVFLGAGAGKIFADSPTIIHACANRVTGNLRVVKPTAACLRSEVAISWNQQGPQGEPGPAAELVVTRRAVHGTVPAGNYADISAECDDDEVVTGGGYSLGSIGFNDKVFTDGPIDDRTWSVTAMNDTAYVLDLWVTAVCLQIGPDATPAP